ncbi:hypothetical protein [Nonomuraea sp. NPDC049400]|uniref:hypothetical protein n=1 Tax=Nonomuraea sp. NPDC049400 TaxID=3364352 RepID=UPI0037B1B3F7
MSGQPEIGDLGRHPVRARAPRDRPPLKFTDSFDEVFAGDDIQVFRSRRVASRDNALAERWVRHRTHGMHRQAADVIPLPMGRIERRQVLGGLISQYQTYPIPHDRRSDHDQSVPRQYSNVRPSDQKQDL